MIDAKIDEGIANAVSHADRHKAELFFNGRGSFGCRLGRGRGRGVGLGIGKCRVLTAHIFNLQGFDLAVLQRLFNDLTGVIGVNVDFDHVLGVNEYCAVADAADQVVKIGSRTLAVVLGLFVDDTLGAVGKYDGIGIKIREVCLLLRVVGSILCLYGVELERREHTRKQEDKAVAACVHHVCFLQDGEQLGGFGKCFFTNAHDVGEETYGVVLIFTLLHALNSLFGTNAHNGEDRSLGGLHHCLVRLVGSFFESLGNVCGGGDLKTFQRLGNAAEKE